MKLQNILFAAVSLFCFNYAPAMEDKSLTDTKNIPEKTAPKASVAIPKKARWIPLSTKFKFFGATGLVLFHIAATNSKDLTMLGKDLPKYPIQVRNYLKKVDATIKNTSTSLESISPKNYVESIPVRLNAAFHAFIKTPTDSKKDDSK